jgi:hypothetical protein
MLPDETDPLPKTDRIQPATIIGKLLYYARAVDSTLNVALSALASEQNQPTMGTRKKLIQLLNYCATHPAAQVTFHASDMILYVHSDAGYNNETKARSRSGGHFYLGNKHDNRQLHNGAILNPTHILKHVATSAADAEIGAAFVNCKEAIPIRITLTEMGYPQPATKVTLDNTTAVNFIQKNLKQRRTKTIDMRYYWLQDQAQLNQFAFVWEKGEQNKADYFTKHHPPGHHQNVRSLYVHHCTQTPLPTAVTHPLRGCADPSSIQRTYDGQTVAVGEPDRLHRPASPTLHTQITDRLKLIYQ